ncbi:MAG: hypothetical protein CMK59_14925 [Proteobacteria bacterium]|nr:hypothetical protein [Pseudomonadota bacterium]
MLLVLFLACDKYKIVKVDEIQDSASTEVDDGACPETVPEEYRYIWDCANDSCGGAMVYRNAVGESLADGSISVVEDWFVFDGETPCVDRFEITGAITDINPEVFNCSTCEEVFEIQWNLVDATCGWNWKTSFADQEEPPYNGYLLLDTHNSFGQRNPDDAMRVLAAPINNQNQYQILESRGTATPTSEQDGYPEDYAWSSSGDCYE